MSEKNEVSTLDEFNKQCESFKEDFVKRVNDGESAYTGEIPIEFLKPIFEESLS